MPRNVLITGAAKRIGAACARHLHARGFDLLLHYHRSQSEAAQLCDELNARRPDSAQLLQADLCNLQQLRRAAQRAIDMQGGIDVLINNASTFYPQPLAEVTEADWDVLFGSNLKAPFFLSQALAATLAARHGCIVNLIDVHAERGLPGYPVYSIAKAGLAAMTRFLARELAPAIRVNGVAPGAILWPEAGASSTEQAEVLSKIAMQRLGNPDDIAKAVVFLIEDAGYVTGQIVTVDGGRSLYS